MGEVREAEGHQSAEAALACEAGPAGARGARESLAQQDIFARALEHPRPAPACAAEILVAPRHGRLAAARGKESARARRESLPGPADGPKAAPLALSAGETLVSVAQPLGAAVAEQRFLTLAALCEVAVLIVGPENDVRYANAAAQALFGGADAVREGARAPLPLARTVRAVHRVTRAGADDVQVQADVSGTWWKDHPVWMACLRPLAAAAVPSASATPATPSVRLELSCFTTTMLVGEARRQAQAMIPAHAHGTQLHITQWPPIMLCADQARLTRALAHLLAYALARAAQSVSLSLRCAAEQGVDLVISYAGAEAGVCAEDSGLAYARHIFASHGGALEWRATSVGPCEILARLPVHILLTRAPAPPRFLSGKLKDE